MKLDELKTGGKHAKVGFETYSDALDHMAYIINNEVV